MKLRCAYRHIIPEGRSSCKYGHRLQDESNESRDSGSVDLLLSQLSLLERALTKERNKSAIIIEAIRSAASALPPVRLEKVPKSPREDPHTAMVDIGDVHLGELVDPVLTGGLSRYNRDIFYERGERFRQVFQHIVGIHRRAYPVEDLYVNLLGDIVTGENVYHGQPFQIDMPLLRQIFEGAHYFAGLIQDFSRTFKSVHVRCVAGNHGAEKDKHPLTNWDVAVYNLLEILLSAQSNIDFEISQSAFLIYQVPGHDGFNHVLAHGNVRGWASIPFYGFERLGASAQSMFGIPISFIHAGHIHNEAKWSSNRVRFLINGSWVGGSDLSVNKMVRNSLPTQSLFFCHPRQGIAASYEIRLDDWTKMMTDSKGIYRPQNLHETAK